MSNFDKDKDDRIEEEAAVAAHAMLSAFKSEDDPITCAEKLNWLVLRASTAGLNMPMIMRMAIKIDKSLFEAILNVAGVREKTYTSNVNSSVYMLELPLLANDKRLEEEKIVKGLKRFVGKSHNVKTLNRFKRAVLKGFILEPFNLITTLVGLPEAVVLTLNTVGGVITAKLRIVLALTLDNIEKARESGETFMKKEGEVSIMLGQSEKAGTVRMMMYSDDGLEARGLCMVSYLELKEGLCFNSKDVRTMNDFFSQKDHNKWITEENKKEKAKDEMAKNPRWENN